MIAAKPCKNRSEASKLEYTIKRLTTADKRLATTKWPLKKNLPKAPR
jgi:predicted GIY-YIG superfamily endonuclease